MKISLKMIILLFFIFGLVKIVGLREGGQVFFCQKLGCDF